MRLNIEHGVQDGALCGRRLCLLTTTLRRKNFLVSLNRELDLYIAYDNKDFDLVNYR